MELPLQNTLKEKPGKRLTDIPFFQGSGIAIEELLKDNCFTGKD